jgi:hypothetical protein
MAVRARESETQRTPRREPTKPRAGRAHPESAEHLLDLQRTAGNQAVVSLIDGSMKHAATPLNLQRKKGVVDMETATIQVGKGERDTFRLKQGEADTAIGKEIDQSIAAVQQGHRQGIANFKSWYRGWVHAKEDSSQAMAANVCKFILGKGLAIIFPEEEAFYETLKKVAEIAFEKAVEHLGETKAGDIDGFLDNLQATEEAEITSLLDARDKFKDEHADVISNAEMEFMIARDDGWPTTDKLPPAALDILHKAGVGLHGKQAATVFSERWLSAHIESIYREDWSVMTGAGPADVGLMAQIAALRQMQRTTGADYRERIWDLERGLPSHFRMMVDINSEHYLMMKIRLGIDEDDAQAISESREKVGPFRDPHELVTRKLLSEKDYKTIETVLVAH